MLLGDVTSCRGSFHVMEARQIIYHHFSGILKARTVIFNEQNDLFGHAVSAIAVIDDRKHTPQQCNRRLALTLP